ncbi:MAG: FAD-binding oxidoreductase [Planctomycetota bacterium]|nr:MAG: FAD-binding oxidoreductase [Planctomycetota bacterium]REK26073.1 MAG: FAD-binding oxidoreductase [Planctomycetota bacterium]REK27061.1 MAG: FAD-binding oxidoreductase [Planctomycetota bacterium]
MNSAINTNPDELTPTSAPELARMVEENAAGRRRPLLPVGGRTALQFGYAATEPVTIVATSELSRVIDYPARDMTVTVEAGLRVEELQKLLKNEGQRLPVDVAQAHRATLGGAIATNTSGPGRFGHGTLRDYVIGISAVDGTGRLFSAGGRVVKNVAGYDLCKLLIGSLGTLAIITQVTLKLRPLAEKLQIEWITVDALDRIDDALAKLLASQTRPVALEVLNPKAAWQVRSESQQDLPTDRFVLCVAFEGSEREVNWQAETLRNELARSELAESTSLAGDGAKKLCKALIEYQAASDDPLTFQATLPPSQTIEFVAAATEAGIALQAHAGNGVIVGHLADDCSSPEQALAILTPLRRLAERSGGALVVHNCEPEWKLALPVFGTLSAPAGLMQRMKQAFDPHSLLNPGRFA